MALNEKECDGKLYRVYHKKGNHQNTKINQDGSKAAIQFTNNNTLDGPLELVEVDESEMVRTEYVEVEPKAKTWKEIILEDIVIPIAKDAINHILEIGIQNFSGWMKEKTIPAAQRKSKEIGENIKIYISGVKSAIKNEEPKAVKLIREKEECEKNLVTVSQVDSVIDRKIDSNSVGEKIQISQEEFENLIALTRKSAATLVGCINLLCNAAVSNTNMDSERQLKLKNQLDGLTTPVIFEEIDLLLEEKNRDVLDDDSLRILAAFNDDEEIMEKQAIGIAPRILMPKNSFIEVANKFNIVSEEISWREIADIAKFFDVSKQSVKIRLRECGIL